MKKTGVLGAVMVPHPPIILPEIGKGEEKHIAEIDEAYRMAASLIEKLDPDTVVIISPHAPAYYDYIQITDGNKARGDLRQFRDWKDTFEVEYDTRLIDEISRICEEQSIPAGTLGEQKHDLDHGTMIPLYYLKNLKPETKFVRIGTGGPSNEMHYRLGMAIEEAALKLGRKIAVVGSGDLSHCQKEDSSYGFKACGPAYDQKIMEIMGQGDFMRLLEMTDREADEAMVCGQKPFNIMAGTLDGKNVDARRLAHSAYFGVGYGICTYQADEDNPDRQFLKQFMEEKNERRRQQRKKEDAYVRLARTAVERAVTHSFEPLEMQDLPEEMLKDQAGVFVSIHENGNLRGCIGTTSPTAESIAQEIVNNAFSASLNDPRFPAIQPWELEDLDIHVDVLKKPEPIQSKEQLDVKKYGVIVTKGRKRGLLLPDLEGVDSIDQQIAIAKSKAGIRENEKDISLMRFEVVRH